MKKFILTISYASAGVWALLLCILIDAAARLLASDVKELEVRADRMERRLDDVIKS